MTTKAQKKALSDAEVADQVAALEQALQRGEGSLALLALVKDLLERVAALEAK